MDYLSSLNEIVSELPSAVCWSVLESKLRALNATAADTGVSAGVEQTAKGWIITFRNDNDNRPVARWSMTSPEPEAVHKWPVEQYAQHLATVSQGYADSSIEELAAALRSTLAKES